MECLMITYLIAVAAPAPPPPSIVGEWRAKKKVTGWGKNYLRSASIDGWV